LFYHVVSKAFLGEGPTRMVMYSLVLLHAYMTTLPPVNISTVQSWFRQNELNTRRKRQRNILVEAPRKLQAKNTSAEEPARRS